MRGKGYVGMLAKDFNRITPAYAGKRDWHVHEAARPKDHPRLCGEKIQNWLACWQEVGSPPPMRGKVFVRILEDGLFRIPPAYAGKRSIITV